jgi:hypothetical protein
MISIESDVSSFNTFNISIGSTQRTVIGRKLICDAELSSNSDYTVPHATEISQPRYLVNRGANDVEGILEDRSVLHVVYLPGIINVCKESIGIENKTE